MKKTQFSFDETAVHAIKNIEVWSRSTNMAQALRISVSVAHAAMNFKQNGWTLYAEKDGERKELVFPFL